MGWRKRASQPEESNEKQEIADADDAEFPEKTPPLLRPPERVKKALQSVYRHNFRHDFWGLPNTQRIYAVNDEQGLLVCSWPNGGRPALPLVYGDEVWTGIEYQVSIPTDGGGEPLVLPCSLGAVTQMDCFRARESGGGG